MTNRFFLPANSVSGITEADYERAGHYIKALKALSQATYESIYVIDYFKKKFLYVSPNPLFLCGHTAEEVMEMGHEFYIRHVPAEEIEYMLGIADKFRLFLMQHPEDERTLFCVSYDAHLNNGEESTLINHRVVPLELDRDGNLWLAVCFVSISSSATPGNVEIRRIGQSYYRRYSRELDRWIEQSDIELTEGEKEVLLLSARGMTIDEIAARVHRSVNTIKSRRKSIFDKLSVRSMNEAITFATNYKLL